MSKFENNNYKALRRFFISGVVALTVCEAGATSVADEQDIAFNVDDNFNILTVDEAQVQTMPVSLETELVESQSLAVGDESSLFDEAEVEQEKTEVVTTKLGQRVQEDLARVNQQEAVPTRGQDAVIVREALGAPLTETKPVGEPSISSWVYPGFVVYFEGQRVLHTVKLKQSGS